MIKKLGKIAILMSSLVLAGAGLFGCGFFDVGSEQPPPPADLGSYTGINDKIADFSQGACGDVFHASNGYGNGGMFDCDWSGGNVVHDGTTGTLDLCLTKGGDNKIYGAEYQSYASFGYGYYSVRMKAIKCDGVVSSFFTYTRHPQWDEIDVEILGNNTNKVQFNYFTNGVGNHEYLFDLGFDASAGFHEYGFKWEEGKITWYVDGRGVYCATASIPSHNGKIIMNAWNGRSEGDNNVANWVGTFDKNNFPIPAAEYKWVGYKQLVAPTPQEYTVTFHKGEGSFAAGENGVRQTTSGKVTPPSVTPPNGKRFKGWYDAATGGNQLDLNTKTFTANSDVYAQYESISSPSQEYTVTFHKGEGSFAAGENGVRQTTSGKVTPPSVTPPNGKRFKGWYDAATGGNQLDFNSKTFTANTDVYAQYEPISSPSPDTEWVNISVDGFNDWGNYTVTKTDGLKISHTAKPEDWASCGMDLDIKYTQVKFTVTNSGTASANFRLDIKKDGAQSGVVSEVTPSINYNEYDRGAVVYGLAVGAHVDIVCKLDPNNVADKLIVLLNSFGDGAAATGSVTITGLMGIPADSATSEFGSYTGINDKIADFTYNDQSAGFERADWSNGGMFDCTWSPENVYHSSSSQSLHLSITNGDGGYKAGEYRTKQKYGYGYYAVKMKAVKKDGVVTSLFTYTGPSDGTEWHEIDIEILGNQTTKVQFNYYTNGVGGHEYLYDLGFDASEDFHEYGFKWENGKITWFVDGVGVYSATADIPSIDGKIMINAWPGKSKGDDNVVDWSGAFDGAFPVQDAEYKWISYRAL